MKKSKMSRMAILTAAVLCFAFNSFAVNTITVTINEDPHLQKWMEEVKKGFEAKHKDVNVKINRIISADNDYHTKLAMSLPTNSSLDIIWLDAYQFYSFYKGKLIAPITEVKTWNERENYYSSMIDRFVYDGESYAMPVSAVVVGLFYNTEIFKKAGLPVPWNPENWNDIYTASKKIKEKVPGVWPFSFSILPSEGSSFGTFLMFLLGSKDGGLYEDGKWVATSRGLLDSLKFLYNMINENLTAPRPVLVQNTPQIVEKKYMPENKIGIRLDGCWIERYWVDKYAKTKDVYSFAPMPTEFGQEPKFVSMQGNWLLAISNKSNNKKLAADFILFAANYENSLKYVNIMSDLTPRKDIGEDKNFPEDLKKFVPYLQYSVFRPHADDYPAVSNELCISFQQILMPGANPLKAMNDFAANLELTVGKDKVIHLYKK